MRLSVSNIAWKYEHDEEMHKYLAGAGFQGIEIAPTRILAENPYDRIPEALEYAERINREYGLAIASMQSIWYSRPERLFGNDEERQSLIEYTRKALDFAKAIRCGNLVFGCPKNRRLVPGAGLDIAIEFFRTLAGMASRSQACIAIEANPPIYGTDYITTTAEAFAVTSEVDRNGVTVNVDIGAMIYNQEDPYLLAKKIGLISHVHVSEPALVPIERRAMHREIANILRAEEYSGFVSLEMRDLGDIEAVRRSADYMKEIFG